MAIRTRGRIITVRVLEVPTKPPPKARASSIYSLIKDEPDPAIDALFDQTSVSELP
ncbi:MAG TPA: hypothetical protein VJX67_26365 [Blastocatellia bacterium]|nr:hypothetical protein [Blastocatellia bacterium]